MVAFYRDSVRELDNERLIGVLEVTTEVRGDGSAFSFLRLGNDEMAAPTPFCLGSPDLVSAVARAWNGDRIPDGDGVATRGL